MATYHDLNYPIFLDRQLTLTGSYSSPSTTWTIPFVDATVDTIVLGAAHGTNAGLILTPDSNVGQAVKVTGDYSAGTATVGRMFTMTVELSRPFVRDAQGTADTNDPVHVLPRFVQQLHGDGDLSKRHRPVEGIHAQRTRLRGRGVRQGVVSGQCQ